MTYLPPDSALHRLQHDELCIIVLHDGRKYEAVWDEAAQCFRLAAQSRAIALGEVYEWWPASVKF